MNERYIRQIMLPGFGEEAQQKLSRSTALLVGVGGLGSTIAPLLCASGIGRLILVDGDTVSLGNLQRQILYRTDQIGKPKVECAAQSLRALNPDVIIETHNEFLTRENAVRLANGANIVIDGTDNAPARYLMDELSRRLHIPYIYGSLQQYQGQAAVFNLREKSPSYRNLYPESSEEITDMPSDFPSPGVLGPLPSLIASIEANEAIKVITGIGKCLDGKLLLVDTFDLGFRIIRI